MTRVCFTEQERHDAGDCADRLAARWAVKEAVAKALGVGLLQGVGLREIETVVDEAGAPRLVLHGGARHLAQTRRLGMWAISVSHERGVAVAMAVAGRGDGPLLDDEEVSDG
jgi:holo-[acyl-carrier protein] synthase